MLITLSCIFALSTSENYVCSPLIRLSLADIYLQRSPFRPRPLLQSRLLFLVLWKI